MLGLSPWTVLEFLVVLLVPAATTFLGDRGTSLPSRLALGLGLAGGLVFLGSVLNGTGGEVGYLIAATIGVGLGGQPRLTSP